LDRERPDAEDRQLQVHGVADEHWRGEGPVLDAQHGDRAAGEHPEPIEQAGRDRESEQAVHDPLAIDRVGGELGVGVDRV